MKPTIRQIKMAEEFALKAGEMTPANVYESKDACLDFISEMYRPTKAQLEMANIIEIRGGKRPFKPFMDMTPLEIHNYIKDNGNYKLDITNGFRQYVKAMAHKLELECPDLDDNVAVAKFAEENQAEFIRRFPKNG